MDLISGIITGLRSIAGIIFPPIKKKYFDQPKVYVVLKHNGGSRSPGGLSMKNDLNKPVDAFNAIRLDSLRWRYELSLRNNSEHAAYNVRLLQPVLNESIEVDPKIDSFRPILPNGEQVFKIIFHEIMEGTGMETYEASRKPPPYFKNGKIIIEYTNVKGTKFYTVYDPNKDERQRNIFTRKLK